MATLQLTSYDLATTYAQVLMPVDYSPPSWNLLSTARHLAEAFGVPMNVLHVDTETHWRDAGDSQQVEHVTPSGEVVRVSDVAERDAPTGISRALGDDESSLLVMSTHGHSGIAELAMGGTANEILRRWQGPLLTSGPQFRVGEAGSDGSSCAWVRRRRRRRWSSTSGAGHASCRPGWSCSW